MQYRNKTPDPKKVLDMLFQDLIPVILLSQKKRGLMNYKLIGCPDIMEGIKNTYKGATSQLIAKTNVCSSIRKH